MIVIGAGPAGAEAAMASARAGASTLCLCINLDNIGFPPATPLLVAGDQDVRGPMLQELAALGGALPRLLGQDGVLAPPAAIGGGSGRVIVDRRHLGLAYKEALENTMNLYLRQALVVKIERCGTCGSGEEPEPSQLQVDSENKSGPPPGPVVTEEKSGPPPVFTDNKAALTGRPVNTNKAAPAGWQVITRLGECFRARALVVAAGTFLGGQVNDAGVITPGGRTGEIPANALGRELEDLGLTLTRIYAEAAPRIDGPHQDADAAGAGDAVAKNMPGTIAQDGNDTSASVASGLPAYELIADGRQLGELMVGGFWPQGNRMAQLRAMEKIGYQEPVWMTRSSWSLTHLALTAKQVGQNLEALRQPGIFFGGRVAGSCNYTEAAVTGLVAGAGAASRAIGQPCPELIMKSKYVVKICAAVARQESRPVTIRITGPGC